MPQDLLADNEIDVSGGIDLLADEPDLNPSSDASRSFEYNDPLSMGRLNEDLVKRGVGIADRLDAPANETIPQTFSKAGDRALGVMAGVSGVGLDVMNQGIEHLYKREFDPTARETIKGWGKELLDTPPVGADESLGESINYAPGRIIKGLGEAYQFLKGKLPETTQRLEDVATIAGGLPVLKGAVELPGMVKAAGKGAAEITGDIYSGITRVAPEKVDAAIRNEIKRGFAKGIKPTIVGKGDAAKTEKFYDKATIATKDIISSNPETIPTTVEEFSQNVRTAKKDLWEKSSTMAREAGEEGARVPMSALRDELQTVIDAPNIRSGEKTS
jgi:hypothetical protein